MQQGVGAALEGDVVPVECAVALAFEGGAEGW